ncbi:MAG TPA: hypothetical protein VFD35_05995 [Pricia sp.]|nr:hypothetical protein [Pricia sp.]
MPDTGKGRWRATAWVPEGFPCSSISEVAGAGGNRNAGRGTEGSMRLPAVPRGSQKMEAFDFSSNGGVFCDFRRNMAFASGTERKSI